MNLVGGKWIPVVFLDASHGRVSLHEAFERGADIRDLHARPHERIALMRLLICVTQAALKGLQDRPEWETLEKEPARMIADAVNYLDDWRSHFELFGHGPRFLQARPVGKSAKKPTAVSKLDLMLASGSNPTVFDNAGAAVRQFTPPDLALMLLTYSCFSPLAGRGYKGRGPCVEDNALHAFLLAPNLLSTVHLNLLPRDLIQANYGSSGSDGWGRPAWELLADRRWASGQLADEATRTYLGRLVPIKWSILLCKDPSAGCHEMRFDNQLEFPSYEEGFREPSITICSDGKKEWVLRASVQRAIWRSLHSIIARRTADSKGGLGGPLTWQNVASGRDLTLWTGGLQTDFKAKIDDAIESTFHIPAAMSASAEQQQLYRQGVEEFAEGWKKALYGAVARYAEDLHFEKEHAGRLAAHASTVFWTEVEHRLSDLFAVAVAGPDTLVPWCDERLNLLWAKTPWGRACCAAAEAAFDRACPRGTPRQLQAWALARRRLRPPLPPGSKPAKKRERKSRKSENQ